jgi:hypothetical protein
MTSKLWIIGVAAAIASSAVAQVDRERLDAAQRRLAEKQQVATQPAGSGRSVEDGAAGSKTWRAKADAPEVIRLWVEELPAMRAARVESFEEKLAAERQVLKEMEADLKRTFRRPVDQVRYKGSLGQWHYKDSPEDAARRRAEVKEQQAVVNQQRAKIGRMEKERKQIADNPQYLPLPTFTDTNGSFGELAGGAKVSRVLDDQNCVISYDGSTYWLAGFDTSGLAANQQLDVKTPVIASGERRSVPGVRRTVEVVKPFAWSDYLEFSDGSESKTGDTPTVRRGPLGEILPDTPTSKPAGIPSPRPIAPENTPAPRDSESSADAALGRRGKTSAGTSTDGANESPSRQTDVPARVVYVVDASGSMIDKLKSVKSEIYKAVANLKPGDSFNLLVAADEKVRSFQPRPVISSTRALDAAAVFLDGLTASGTSNMAPAMDMALKQDATLVWLVTDGDMPNNNEFLLAVRQMNRSRRAKINTVAAGYSQNNPDETSESFLRFLAALAAEHGGKCFDMTGAVVEPAKPATPKPVARNQTKTKSRTAIPPDEQQRPTGPSIFDLRER